MSRFVRTILIVVLLAAALPAAPALAADNPQATSDETNCTEILHGTYGHQASGASYCIVIPPNWNKNLVIFAHGYVDPTTGAPAAIPYDQLVLPDNTTTIPGLVMSMGFAFAVTSYSKTGLAVEQGVAEVADLAVIFKTLHPDTRRVYLIGASEGGLVTALAIEKNYRNLFSGGVATCGPVGDFQKQINYWGDFRVMYDYFFGATPAALPPTPVSIPPPLYDQWRTYVPAMAGPFHVELPQPGPLQVGIGGAVLYGAQLPPGVSPTVHLFGVTKAPFDAADPVTTMVASTVGLLSYNILATNDGVFTLGGQPYNNDNPFTTYHDSSPVDPVTDAALNAPYPLGAWRTTADPVDLSPYQTTGKLKAPLVTMHNTGDPIVPYWHETLYFNKVLASGSFWKYINIPVARYGHCNFKAYEALFAFWVMVIRSGFYKIPIMTAANTLADPGERAAFIEMAAPYADEAGIKVYIPFTSR